MGIGREDGECGGVGLGRPDLVLPQLLHQLRSCDLVKKEGFEEDELVSSLLRLGSPSHGGGGFARSSAVVRQG